ncbi:hypothetical protein C8Q74DRAFT_1373907 [Fomes fomentarius]|nr:hypothetical protein C8Q74DRAFT_1373907 [Fomes fomentarius]
MTHTQKNWLVIRAKAALTRITLTPHTLAFFLLSVVHCVAQGLTAAFVYSEDASSYAFINSVVRTADVPKNEVARLFRSGTNLTLKLCTAAPIGDRLNKDCETVWSTTTDVGQTDADLVPRFLSEVSGSTEQRFLRRNIDESMLQPLTDPNTGSIVGVKLTFDDKKTSVNLSQRCARTLEYPERILDNSRREDLALIGSQFWLLGISTFGILWNSIPHIWAVVFARVMQSAWATYTLWRTSDVKFRYDALITGQNTPCSFDFLPMYFTTRTALQIPELVLNLTALISTSFLGWRIVKRVHDPPRRPPANVMRLYKLFLVNSMFLQLSLFFTITAISLWVDQLRHSSIAFLSRHSPIYYGLFIFTIVTIIPWMLMGWFAIRRELKLVMAGFMFLVVAYIVCWGVMFYSEVYRWTFIEWPFFACSTLVSMVVLLGSVIFGTISWMGFGKGLAHYLHVEAVLMESDFNPDVFSNEDREKGAMNSQMGSPIGRAPSALSHFSASGVSVLKKDTNWDFADSDVDRPAIYTIDVQSKGNARSTTD